MGVSTLGLGTPFTSLAPTQAPWGLSQPGGINPYALQQLYGQSPSSMASTVNPIALQPLQQVSQLLQIVPQQLQHLIQLQYLQQHQLQQLQQIVQLIPAQLAQLQQLTQIIPQQLQQAQPFTQLAGGSGLSGVTPWSVSPHLFGGQASYLM